MTGQAGPTVFLSHSHVDKRIARRLVRRLNAHGVRVWIDERELRVGDTLTSSIRRHIQDADTFLVIASQASERSPWVGRELKVAKDHDKTIIPLFIDDSARQQNLSDHLGVDGTGLQSFATAITNLIRDLYLSLDLKTPAADPQVLTEGLRELVREEPDLAPLILGCLDSQGLHQENMDTVYKVAFHALDEAVNALFELTPDSTMAYHAAYAFRQAGAGARALSQWIAATGDGESPLVTAVGSALELSLINVAIELLASCNPPNNHALYQFIDRNSARLDNVQRRSVIRLVTWPLRSDTDRLGDVLGWVALRQFPDATAIQQMWARWIRDGVFDGKPSSPTDLARYLSDARAEGLPGWEAVEEALRSHVRSCLRSRNRDRVVMAMDHVRAAADVQAPVLSALLREVDGVSGTAEWESWTALGPDEFEWMKWYVFEVAKEAAGDRDWLRALDNTKNMVAFEKARRQAVERNKP
jgi:hypothetical protein